MAITNVTFQRRQKYQEPTESGMGKLLGVAGLVAGGVAGGMAGGPKGAILGAQAGQGLGSTIGGYVDPAKAGGAIQEAQAQAPQQMDNAISRRVAQQAEDKLAVLKQAEAALPYVTKDMRDQYASTIVKATMEEERRRAMGA